MLTHVRRELSHNAESKLIFIRRFQGNSHSVHRSSEIDSSILAVDIGLLEEHAVRRETISYEIAKKSLRHTNGK